MSKAISTKSKEKLTGGTASNAHDPKIFSKPKQERSAHTETGGERKQVVFVEDDSDDELDIKNFAKMPKAPPEKNQVCFIPQKVE